MYVCIRIKLCQSTQHELQHKVYKGTIVQKIVLENVQVQCNNYYKVCE